MAIIPQLNAARTLLRIALRRPLQKLHRHSVWIFGVEAPHIRCDLYEARSDGHVAALPHFLEFGLDVKDVDA